jgi:cysteine desulfurase
MRVYLDNAATTPISKEVLEVMIPVMQDQFGNPSSIHADGRKIRSIIEEARKTVANHIGASIGEIFFTSGGTESNNMALKCAVRDLGVTRIISSKLEHHCILHCLESMDLFDKVSVEYAEFDSEGCINIQSLEQLIKSSDKPTLVSLMHANNEIGAKLDLEAVSKICAENKVYFHSDSVQTMGHFPINVADHKISFLSGSAHKFHGPKGVGFIYINGENIIKPYIEGGSQERNMRAGTENVYGIVGLAKAFDLACTHMDERAQHIKTLRTHLKSRLVNEFDDIQFNGPDEGLYTVLSVSFPPNDKSSMLLIQLDMSGISASGGSACSSGADVGSHVLQALGADPSRKTIRFSFSHYNTIAEMDFLIEKLKTIIPAKQTVA